MIELVVGNRELLDGGTDLGVLLHGLEDAHHALFANVAVRDVEGVQSLVVLGQEVCDGLRAFVLKSRVNQSST